MLALVILAIGLEQHPATPLVRLHPQFHEALMELRVYKDFSIVDLVVVNKLDLTRIFSAALVLFQHIGVVLSALAFGCFDIRLENILVVNVLHLCEVQHFLFELVTPDVAWVLSAPLDLFLELLLRVYDVKPEHSFPLGWLVLVFSHLILDDISLYLLLD